jgi:alpha-galactosidase
MNNKLQMYYYGNKIINPTELKKNTSEHTSAFSTFGGSEINEPAFRLTHVDGNLSTELVFQKVVTNKLNDNQTQTIISLKDAFYPVFVEMYFTASFKEDIIETQVKIRHTEKGFVQIHNVSSFYLPVHKNKVFLTHFHGDWGNEMMMKEELLTEGIKIIDSKEGVRTTRMQSPSFILSFNKPAQEDAGDVIFGHIAWSGSWRLAFEVDRENRMFASGGYNPFASDYKLRKDEIFETPKAILTFSSEGKGKASRNFHNWARNYVIQEGTRMRPVLLNNWEGTMFNFDQQIIARIIDGAKELGVEMFVLDDAWFGNKYPRNDEKNGLGDWQVNKQKLPQGIEFLVDKCNNKDLKFGIWIEPEMVNPRSELFEKHPEWVIQQPNRKIVESRYQYILDLGKPMVQEFVFKIVDDLMTANPQIYYIKWDCNRHILNPGSTNLEPDFQEHIWINYTHGLYNVLDRIKKKYPHVIFQSCASGGGRVDYGSMAYFHEFWSSDNTDALQRIYIQWGYSQFFPAIAMAAHVSNVPNHQTDRTVPFKFRFDVAMSGRLGIEMQPDQMTTEEKEFAKKAIQNYYRIRETVQLGDLYRLVSPWESDIASLMYVSSDKTKGVFFAWQLKRAVGMHPEPILLKGLNPASRYKVTEINCWETEPKSYIASGDYLMKVGMRVSLNKWIGEAGGLISFKTDFDSEVYVIDEVKN